MATRRGRSVERGMKVFTSEGRRIGRVREVAPPEDDEDIAPPDPFRPVGNQTAVIGDRIDLDITGAITAVAEEQPGQRSRGGRPGESPHPEVDAAGREDVGDDFKQLGETLDTRAPDRAADQRVTDGWFKVATGLDSSDLYIPLGAVARIRDDDILLATSLDELNRAGWGRKPPGA